MAEVNADKGVCCFSAVNDSTLMWAHYADSFRGVCLVYDCFELINGTPFVPLRVTYHARIPKFNYVRHRLRDAQKEVPHDFAKGNHEFDQAMFATKTDAWAYEHEYRLLSFRQGRNDVLPGTLKGVIFGSRTTELQRERIGRLTREYPTAVEFTTVALDAIRKQVKVDCFENQMLLRTGVKMRNLYREIKSRR